MRGEINIFFNALLLYTRVAVPRSVVCTEQSLSNAFRYFPFVGIIVGGVGAGVLWLGSQLLPLEVAVILSMAGMLLTTGAFHEDGLADIADGFGAGRDKESILRIMKDSHIGTYGVLTLILAQLLKFFLISSLGGVYDVMIAIVVAQAISRFLPIVMLATTSYVRGEGSKTPHAKLGVRGVNIVVAALMAIPPMLLLGWEMMLVYMVVAAIFFILFRCYTIRKIGGCTGDTLGAVQQISELLFYITLVALQSL